MATKAGRFMVAPQLRNDLSELLSGSDEQPVGSLEVIPLNRIKFDPDQPRKLGLVRENPALIDANDPDAARKRAQLAELEELGSSIKTVGLIEPIGVYLRGQDYMLIWGERRVLASQIAGQSHIEARILPERPRNLRAQQLAENFFRSALSLIERVDGIERLCSERRSQGHAVDSAAELIEALGMAQAQAYRYWAILNGPDDVRAAIRSGALTNLKTAARIAAIESHEERLAALALAASENGDARTEEAPAKSASAASEKRPKGRGRPATTIQLGRTKSPGVARYIAERLLDKRDLEDFRDANWDDMSVATDILRQVIKKIEARLAKKTPTARTGSNEP
jgi:ParB/RepB/Spo0J family partition protein